MGAHAYTGATQSMSPILTELSIIGKLLETVAGREPLPKLNNIGAGMRPGSERADRIGNKSTLSSANGLSQGWTMPYCFGCVVAATALPTNGI